MPATICAASCSRSRMPSGTLALDSYGLHRPAAARIPAPLTMLRRSPAAALFSPLGAALEQTDAGGHRQRSRFDLAGQLKQVHLRINGKTEWQPVLLDAQYNAAGQIIEQQAGNGVRNRWTYRLGQRHVCTTHRRTTAAGDGPAGFRIFITTVSAISAASSTTLSQPVYFANQRVDGHRRFHLRLAVPTGAGHRLRRRARRRHSRPSASGRPGQSAQLHADSTPTTPATT